MPPSRVTKPPCSKVAVKPTRIAILINGTKAALSLIALRLASRYACEAALTRSTSSSSLVKLLIVLIPLKLLERSAFRSPTSFRTSAYRGPIRDWNLNEPQIITGIGITE